MFEGPINLWYLLVCYHFLYHFDVHAIAVQFIYRYLVLTRCVQINFRRYLLLITIPFVLCVFTTWRMCEMIGKPLPHSAMNMSSNLFDDFQQQNQIIAVFLVDQTAQLIVMTVMPIFYFYIISYSIIFFCGRQMVRFVGAHAMNERFRELNMQLTRSLIIIAIWPLIADSAIFFIILSTLTYSMENVALFVNILIPLLAVFNPLANIWTFRPYRDTLLKRFNNHISPA